MASIPKRVEDRLAAGIKRFQTVLAAAKSRDVNESDTVVILNDIFAEVFGYDKYFEVTSEFSIRGTYCDLAIKLDGKVQVLIEAKAVGIELKDQHVKQAIDYAANQGIDWVVLTNAQQWRIYKVVFAKPIDQELVCDFNFAELDHRNDDHLGLLFLLSKEGWSKSAVADYHQQKQALSRFFVGAAVLSESVLTAIRRELKRVSPEVRIEVEQIANVLSQEVIKRDVLENEKYTAASKAIVRAAAKSQRTKAGEAVASPVVASPTASNFPSEPTLSGSDSAAAPIA